VAKVDVLSSGSDSTINPSSRVSDCNLVYFYKSVNIYLS
jgi:hypothetical protein